MLKSLQFASLVLLAILLMPLGAHAFELPNKITLSRDAYFVVQRIYDGWAWFGIVMALALGINVLLAIASRGRGAASWLAFAAAVAVALSFVIFFVWTQPANQVTRDWTIIPTDWRGVRAQWEYSHAANAVVIFLGFCSSLLSALMRRTRA